MSTSTILIERVMIDDRLQSVVIADGKVVEISETIDSSLYENVYKVGEGTIALPGFIDLHIHGAAGADTMDATQEALQMMADALLKEGTTSFLPTTMTASPEAIELALANVAQFAKQQTRGAKVIGIHLEGPFISHSKIGAQNPLYVQVPSIEQFKRWQEVAEGLIRVVTIAPEEEGALDVIEYLASTGVIASIGHSNANSAIVHEAIRRGATHVTHLYNGMSAFSHREPNVAGVALMSDVYTELIADGIHVCDDVLTFTHQVKTADRIVLITDAMRAKCLGKGQYDLGGQTVYVADGQATLQDGTLAGSVLKMNDAVKRMSRLTGCSCHELSKMSSTNAATELKREELGQLTVGAVADIVLLNKEFDVIATFVNGEVQYEQKESIV